MDLSVTDPIERAIDRTKWILFQPFDAGKWFALGFCAFLAHLGSGGGFNAYNPAGRLHDRSASFQSIADTAQEWITAHLLLVGILVATLVVLGILAAWLQARGQFMFLDGVARNRSEVAAPWREFAQEGNRLFGFTLLYGLAVLVGIGLILGLGFAVALPDIRAEQFGGRAALALAIGLPLLLVFVLASAAVTILLRDFVVPAMYRRRIGVMEAWSTVRHEVLAGRLGTIILYFLMKMALAMGIGILAFLAICLTCCCAALPYLGTVILLPLFVFNRSYPLCFLEQLGRDWQFFQEPEVLPAPSPDLQS
jgi:hypothetical protein